MRNLLPSIILLLILPAVGMSQTDAAIDTMFYEFDAQDTSGVFDDYNFNTGEYKLFATHWSEEIGHPLSDSLGLFYISDTALLNELKRTWHFRESNSIYYCGYDYIFYLTHDDSVVEKLSLNISCNSLVGTNSNHYFEADKLRVLYGRVPALRAVEVRTKDRSIALNKLDSISKLSDHLVPEKSSYLWSSYPGHFYFSYAKNREELLGSETVETNIQKELQTLYPESSFSIAFKGGGPNYYLYRLYCTRALYDKFNLYSNKKEYEEIDSFRIVGYQKLQ
jgi:hypothetical protein